MRGEAFSSDFYEHKDVGQSGSKMSIYNKMDDIYAHKKISVDKLKKDIQKLLDVEASGNRCFAGNAFLYHHMIEHLCRVRLRGRYSLEDIVKNPSDYTSFYDGLMKLNRAGTMAYRIYEHHRFNGGVVFFKPTIAKYIARLFGAKHMLDPCAGWGGRMLGAWAAGCDYTGYDTNVDLCAAYDTMISYLKDSGGITMRWENFLTADISGMDYDLVLTSPPYYNLEVYQHMEPFKNKSAYYQDFLIPLIQKSIDNMKSGWVCINISPKIYKELTEDYGFQPCIKKVPMLQQKRLNRDKGDFIYCWTK